MYCTVAFAFRVRDCGVPEHLERLRGARDPPWVDRGGGGGGGSGVCRELAQSLVEQLEQLPVARTQGAAGAEHDAGAGERRARRAAGLERPLTPLPARRASQNREAEEQHEPGMWFFASITMSTCLMLAQSKRMALFMSALSECRRAGPPEVEAKSPDANLRRPSASSSSSHTWNANNLERFSNCK